MQSDRTEMLPIEKLQATKGDAAQTVGLLQDRIEDWIEIARRRIDNPQHLGGCGLLLQSFARLGNKPRIFNCNDRLVSEGADELDLTLGERFYAPAGQN